MSENHCMHINACGRAQYPEGIKWTRQRRDVYDVLSQAKEPLTAAQIYSRLDTDEEESVYAVSTIYRILSSFVEKGFVEKSSWMSDGTIVYELQRGTHTHYAVCMQCHKKIPLSHCPFVQLNLQKEAEDFTVVSHKLEIYGYCKDCRTKKKD